MKTKKRSNKITIYAVAAVALAVVVVAGILLIGGQDGKEEALAPIPTKTQADAANSDNANSDTAESDGQGITINKDEITEVATFFPYQSGDTDMEVIAIRATDGTVRTALNTCQVCFDSGRGYYKQDGDVLVCQNCGNRFSVDQVEVVKGGCNPVPIFDDQKTETDDTITISDDVLAQYKTLFSEWKK